MRTGSLEPTESARFKNLTLFGNDGWPSLPEAGQISYDSTGQNIGFYNGSSWVVIGSVGSLPDILYADVGRNYGFGDLVFGSITTGLDNIAIGNNAATLITEGRNSVAIGTSSLESNLTSWNNVAIGYRSLRFTLGEGNIGIGTTSLGQNEDGVYNCAVGYSAGYGVVDGVNNTFFGSYSGPLSDVSSGVFIGFKAGYTSGQSNQLWIANEADGGTKANTWLFGDSSFNVEIPNGYNAAQNFFEKVVAHGTVSSGTEDFDVSLGGGHSIEVTGNQSWTLSGWPSSKHGHITIMCTVSGGSFPTINIPTGTPAWRGDISLFTNMEDGDYLIELIPWNGDANDILIIGKGV